MMPISNYMLFEVIADSAVVAIEDIGEKVDRVRWMAESQLDPNDWRTVKDNSIGLRFLPLDHAQACTQRIAGACAGGGGKTSAAARRLS